ncbi:nickel-dependent lactate racemase [Paenibacillus xerothermodurans]|uniref:Nickel-dependent lactate racemase n=1 Tax=Paenibacillus xerothermodurans TaxID=1977292 RepID=A0A2W1N6C1_PAEXE|nr:nickel-dependent lactate racemase [Paenibacillus xerothermodurans]
MSIITLPYGKSTLEFSISPLSADTITYSHKNAAVSADTSASRIRHALVEPHGTAPLRVLARGKQRVVILISDGTRLSPSAVLLPEILHELNEAGVPDDAVDVIIALGMHRKHTEAEIKELVGSDTFHRVRIHNHSAAEQDCVRLGVTSAGTPIEINRTATKADLRIATGNIEPHALVGISGGVKALIPGIASRNCIEHNHSLSLQHTPIVGQPDNAIHRDLEEALNFISIDFLLNVVVDHNQNVMEAVAGDPVTAHRIGVTLAECYFLVPVDQLYDIVLVSPGGHPKDIQLYQAIKSLRNAATITKPGGTILMAAECSEMFGNGLFQFWVETKDREHAVASLKQQFVLGPHKVLHVDEVISKHTVYLKSTVPQPLVKLLGFEPVDDLRSSFKHIISNSVSPSIAVMPHGALTYPVVKNN